MSFWGYYVRQSLRLVRRRGRRRDDGEADDYIEERQPNVVRLVGEVVRNLMDRIGTVPQSHFDRLRERLEAELEREGLALD